jgi:macrolide-specific efflux system membrane fusion protein
MNGLLVIPLVLFAAESGQDGSIVEASGALISVVEQVDVPAHQQGPITSILVEEGDLVEKGTLLATCDDQDALLAKQRAEIELETARADAENTIKIRLAEKSLELAESELARAKMSRERLQDAISDEEIEHRQLKVDEARLQVEQAEYEQQQARDKARLSENAFHIAERNLARCRILAPISGVVVQIHRQTGEWSEPGETLLRIVRVDRLRAEAYVDADELPMGVAGSRVRLTVSTPQGNRELDGVLKFVSPEVNPVDGRVRVWAEFKSNDPALRPGMRAILKIESAPAEGEPAAGR